VAVLLVHAVVVAIEGRGGGVLRMRRVAGIVQVVVAVLGRVAAPIIIVRMLFGHECWQCIIIIHHGRGSFFFANRVFETAGRHDQLNSSLLCEKLTAMDSIVVVIRQDANRAAYDPARHVRFDFVPAVGCTPHSCWDRLPIGTQQLHRKGFSHVQKQLSQIKGSLFPHGLARFQAMNVQHILDDVSYHELG
jgi:hypothetical protein